MKFYGSCLRNAEKEVKVKDHRVKAFFEKSKTLENVLRTSNAKYELFK